MLGRNIRPFSSRPGEKGGKFLLELGRNYSDDFLILYVYLFDHIPEQYFRFNLIFLGLSKNTPDILRKHGLIE